MSRRREKENWRKPIPETTRLRHAIRRARKRLRRTPNVTQRGHEDYYASPPIRREGVLISSGVSNMWKHQWLKAKVERNRTRLAETIATIRQQQEERIQELAASE